MNSSIHSSLWGQSTQYFYKLSPEKILSSLDNLGERTTGRALGLMSMENRVYEIEIEPKIEIRSPSEAFRVVKFYRPGRWKKEAILEEHEFLLELQDLELPVIAPLVYDGKTLFHWEEGDIYYAVFPKRGGRSLQELSSPQAVRLARTLGRIHGVGKTRSFNHRPILEASSFIDANLDFLQKNQFIPLSLQKNYGEIAQKISQEANASLPKLAYQRIHGDCHYGNVLWSDETPLFLDFDDTMMGPCVQDLWPLLSSLDSPEEKEQWIEAYETFQPFDRSSLSYIPLLRAMRIIHYSAWIARRFEDPAFSKVFVNFREEDYWQREQHILHTLLNEFQQRREAPWA